MGVGNYLFVTFICIEFLMNSQIVTGEVFAIDALPHATFNSRFWQIYLIAGQQNHRHEVEGVRGKR